MEKEITMKDIAEAIKSLEENKLPNKITEYDWGWITNNSIGIPIKIEFKKNQIDAIKKEVRFLPINLEVGKIGTIYGLKVVVKKE